MVQTFLVFEKFEIFVFFQEKCDQYWPESGDPVFYGDVQVAKMHETITPDWTVTEFKITLVCEDFIFQLIYIVTDML